MPCGIKVAVSAAPFGLAAGNMEHAAPVRLIPDTARAFAELREIAGTPEGLVEINRLIDSGTPILRAYIDDSAAIGAGHAVARYEISKFLLPFLAAVRARNGKVGEVQSALDHGSFPEMVHPGTPEVYDSLAQEGGITVSQIDLPDWLSPEEIRSAVQLIENWEASQKSACELLADLAPLLRGSVLRHQCLPNPSESFQSSPG